MEMSDKPENPCAEVLLPNSEMSDKEQLCRMVFAAQGCEVLKFWLDEEDYGTCEVKQRDGSFMTFTQNPNKASKVFRQFPDGTREYFNEDVRKAT